MNAWSKILNRILWFVFFCLGFYIVFAGGQRLWPEDTAGFLKSGRDTAQRALLESAVRCLYPGMLLEGGEDVRSGTWYEWYIERALAMHPLYRLQSGAEEPGALESAATYEILAAGGVHDENETDENGQAYDMAALAEAENEQAAAREEEQRQEELRQSRRPSGLEDND